MPSLLLDDEKVERIVEGFFMTGTTLSATNVGGGGSILVATDRRLIFLYKGWFTEASEDYRYSQVGSIQCDSGFVTAKPTGRSGEEQNEDISSYKRAGPVPRQSSLWTIKLLTFNNFFPCERRRTSYEGRIRVEWPATLG